LLEGIGARLIVYIARRYLIFLYIYSEHRAKGFGPRMKAFDRLISGNSLSAFPRVVGLFVLRFLRNRSAFLDGRRDYTGGAG